MPSNNWPHSNEQLDFAWNISNYTSMREYNHNLTVGVPLVGSAAMSAALPTAGYAPNADWIRREYDPDYPYDAKLHLVRYLRYFREQSPGTVIGTYVSGSACKKNPVDVPAETINCAHLADQRIDGMLLFRIGLAYQSDLEQESFSWELREVFETYRISLSERVIVTTEVAGRWWRIADAYQEKTYSVIRHDGALDVHTRKYIDINGVDGETLLEFILTQAEAQADDWGAQFVFLDNIDHHYPPQLWPEPMVPFLDRLHDELNNSLAMKLVINLGLPKVNKLAKNSFELSQELEQLTDGLSFEQAFHWIEIMPFLLEVWDEIAFYQRWLGMGKLILFCTGWPSMLGSGEGRLGFIRYLAALAMIIRNPDEAIFVQRWTYMDRSFFNWLNWPAEFGMPLGEGVATKYFQPVSDFLDANLGGWEITRGFQNGTLTVAHRSVLPDDRRIIRIPGYIDQLLDPPSYGEIESIEWDGAETVIVYRSFPVEVLNSSSKEAYTTTYKGAIFDTFTLEQSGQETAARLLVGMLITERAFHAKMVEADTEYMALVPV